MVFLQWFIIMMLAGTSIWYFGLMWKDMRSDARYWNRQVATVKFLRQQEVLAYQDRDWITLEALREESLRERSMT